MKKIRYLLRSWYLLNFECKPISRPAFLKKYLTHSTFFICFYFLLFPIFICPFFSQNRRYLFNFFLLWTSCIAEIEAQTVFSLISLSTEILNLSCLSFSWGTVLILPNGRSSSQTSGLGIHYGLLEFWGPVG